MQYLYADITIKPYSEDISDIISAMISEIGFDSFENTDYGLKAYINKDEFDEDTLSSTLSFLDLPDNSIAYTIHELENKDWNEQWEKEHFDPILEREFGIKLDPKMAFGSGAHDTTYQITSQLLSMDFSGQRVLDMGTGTGVLAIAMAMKGAKDIVAIDIDEFSVENAKENFKLNSLDTLANAEVLLGDASAIEGTFNTIVANIHKNILKADMPTYVQHLAPKGTLIISGFFIDDVPEMTDSAIASGLRVDKIIQKNEWVVMLLCA